MSSVDALIAILLFLAVFAFMRGIWANNLSAANDKITAIEQQFVAEQTMMVLTQTPGNPIDWTLSSVFIPGLAINPFVLEQSKVSEFCSITHSNAAEYLGLGKFDFNFKLSYGNGTVFPCTNHSITATNGSVVRISKRVLYNGGDANVEIFVFK